MVNDSLIMNKGSEIREKLEELNNLSSNMEFDLPRNRKPGGKDRKQRERSIRTFPGKGSTTPPGKTQQQ